MGSCPQGRLSSSFLPAGRDVSGFTLLYVRSHHECPLTWVPKESYIETSKTLRQNILPVCKLAISGSL